MDTVNEDISRILQLLEHGAITAGEAELLIRTLHEAESAPPRGPDDAAHRGEGAPFRAAARRLRSLARTQGRWLMWRLYRFHEAHAHAREERARATDALGRVRFVLERRVFVDPEGLGASSRLREDLRLDAMALDVLRMALETEFDIDLDPAVLAGMKTVQEVADRMAIEESAPVVQPAAPDAE